MNIKQIKEKYTCLDYLGKPLKKTSSGWHVYRCPWKKDTHPSLTVSPNGKVWRDLSNPGAKDAEGGIIELVQKCLNTKDFKAVCAEFDSSSFSLSNNLDYKKEKDLECSKFASFSVLPLQSRGLYAYLYSRKIDLQIAKQFLKEAHYSFRSDDDRYLYALAYGNNLGGYELRGAPYYGNQKGYKGGTAPKGITTHWLVDGAPVVVLEGFMDMLSWVTLTGGVKHNLVVLNSTVNVPAAVESLKGIDNNIYLALDNDKAGRNATSQIMAELSGATDLAYRYAPAKDVNDYLMNLHKK